MYISRYFIKCIIIIFINLFIRRFDILVVGNPAMLKANLSMLILGIITLKLSRQVLVKIKVRINGL